MGAVPWCGAGFPLEMSPAHQGTAPEGLDLNYGWNFLLILYPEEYQIPDGEGWEDAGREESLERWICWEGSTCTTGKPRCFGVGFLFLSPAAALGWGQTKEPGFQRTTQIQPPPAHFHGRIQVQTGFASGWVGAPQLQEKQKQNLRRFSSKFFFAPHMVHSKS